MRPVLRCLITACLAAAVPVAATAQTSFSTQIAGLDVMSATVLQEGQSSFSGLAIRARLKSPELVDNITILPTIEYWRNSSTVSTFGIHSVRKDATLGLDGRWAFTGETFKPYVGAGLAVHFLSSQVNAPSLGLPDASDSVVKGGVALLAGVDWALTQKLGNILEAKYHHVGEYKQLKINWGLSWGF